MWPWRTVSILILPAGRLEHVPLGLSTWISCCPREVGISRPVPLCSPTQRISSRIKPQPNPQTVMNEVWGPFIKKSYSVIQTYQHYFIFFCFECVMFFPAVWIFSDKRAYATQTDIKFVAVTEAPNPLYFHWRFEDGPEIKTTSRIFKKRYRLPNKCVLFLSNLFSYRQSKEFSVTKDMCHTHFTESVFYLCLFTAFVHFTFLKKNLSIYLFQIQCHCQCV